MEKNGAPRRLPRFIPRSLAASMEAESREWMDRCGVCGYEQSVWDLGGIRWKAAGNPKQYRGCPNCGQRSWHTIYRPGVGAPPPPPLAAGRPRRRVGLWIAAPLALVVLVVVAVGVFLLVGAFRDVGRARGATSGYFAALIAHDWPAAQGYLSAPLRARYAPADLQAGWAPSESAHGAATGFSLGGTSVRNGTARVDGTLRYRDGTAERYTVRLIKESGAWKIAQATASAP